MGFSKGIERLQVIINFVSIEFRTKKEIMAFLRNQNIIISYRTLDRDLKQITEDFKFELENKKGYGYKVVNQQIEPYFKAGIKTKNHDVGYENSVYKILNQFRYNGIDYCNILDKATGKIFVVSEK